MTPEEHQPGEHADAFREYEELNVFGTPTGRVVLAAKDEDFPDAPRGFSWRLLAERSAAEIRARAAEYRHMADAARTLPANQSLQKLAERLEEHAARRERVESGQL